MRSSEATSRWWDCNPTAFASLLWCMKQQSLDNEAVCAVFLSAANYFFKKVDQADAKRILAKGMLRLTVRGNMSKILEKYTCECFRHMLAIFLTRWLRLWNVKKSQGFKSPSQSMEQKVQNRFQPMVRQSSDLQGRGVQSSSFPRHSACAAQLAKQQNAAFQDLCTSGMFFVCSDWSD